MFHLAAARPARVSAELLRRVGAIVHLEPYDARLRLNSAFPRGLQNYDTYEEAASAARDLWDVELRSTIFEEARMPPCTPFAVRRWEFAEGEVRATDHAGRVMTLPNRAIARAVFGRRVVRAGELDVEVPNYAGPYGTLGDGDVVKREEIKQLSLFALLLPQAVSGSALLFDAGALDFQCLGHKPALSDNANVLRLFETIRETYPAVPVDRQLLEQRLDAEHFRCFHRQSGVDAAIATAYVMDYLRRAESEPAGFYDGVMALL